MTNWSAVRDNFVAGLLLVTPLLITLWILRILVNFALQFIDPVVQETDLSSYVGNVEVVAQVIAVVLILLFVSSIGFLAKRRVGQRLFGSLGRIVTLIPLIRTIYATVRQLLTSFSSSESSVESLVLVEFPRRGIYAIGLITGESPQAVNDVAGAKSYNVFLPSSPNPAGGRLVMVPEDQVHEVDLSVREGLGLIMTTGATAGETDQPLPEGMTLPDDETTRQQTGGGDDTDE